MRKFQTFRPSLVTKTFFKHHSDPSEINKGECFIWAYLVHLLFKEVELWYMDTHAFVKYRGKFYDSERLRGVSNWQDLPATEGGRCTAKKFTIETFKRGWKGQPKYFGTSWENLEASARKVIRREQASV